MVHADVPIVVVKSERDTKFLQVQEVALSYLFVDYKKNILVWFACIGITNSERVFKRMDNCKFL